MFELREEASVGGVMKRHQGGVVYREGPIGEHELTAYALRYLASDVDDHRPLMAARLRGLATTYDHRTVTHDEIIDAFSAYADGRECPGLLVEPGVLSGCVPPEGKPNDCPTCMVRNAVIAGEA